MQQVKVIVQGRLEFSNPNSYEKALRMYEHRIENFYKADLFITAEIFDEEHLSINIPRLVVQGPVKYWTNTVRLLDYLSQFAVSGWIGAWQVEQGVILKYAEIEPRGDKAVIQNFLKGRKLAEEKGKEKEAIKSLNKAIAQYDKHAQAYGWRGYVNFLLGNLEDAQYDFEKCIRIDPEVPSAYFWRAKVFVQQKKWDEAIADFLMTTKKAIALQPIYWKSRRLKAECHIQKAEWDEAEKELKLFCNRKFGKGDPNEEYRQTALYLHAQMLEKLEQFPAALQAVDKALELKDLEYPVAREDLLTLRGKIKQQSGASGKADWKLAAELGSKEASKLLEK